MKDRLGVGFIGSGFITKFHIQSFEAVRDADIMGVWSPNRAHAEEAAALARDLGVGEARAHDSITEMVADPAVDAIWICGPNHTRIENVEELCAAVNEGKGELKGVACEKPLARNVAERPDASPSTRSWPVTRKTPGGTSGRGSWSPLRPLIRA